MGTHMNVITEPLHQDDKALPWGLHVRPSYGMYNCGSQKTDVQLYNTKDHPIVLKKGTPVARMVAANEVPETVVADGTVGALWTHRWAKEGRTRLSVKERRKVLFEKLELSSGASLWRVWGWSLWSCALQLLYTPFLHLLVQRYCGTRLADSRLSLYFPLCKIQDHIPSGLLDKVKEHLDHMLDMGAIKPSKLAWCNAVVLVWKKDGGLGFALIFRSLTLGLERMPFHCLEYMMPSMPSVEASITPLSISFLDFGKPPWKSLQSNIQLSLWGH